MNDEKEVDKSVSLMYDRTYDQARKIMSEFSTNGRVSAGASALWAVTTPHRSITNTKK